MFRMFKLLFFTILILGLLISGFAMVFANENEPVKVVACFPQTGASATWGVLAVEGVRLGVEQINAAGGLLGRPLELVVLDNQGKAAVSVAAMKKAVGLKPYVVFGTNMSGSTIINMEILEKAGIPQFSGSTSPNITLQGNKNIFMACLNANNLTEKSKDWIVNSRSFL